MTLPEVTNFIRSASRDDLTVIFDEAKKRRVGIGITNMRELRRDSIVLVSGGICEFVGKVVETDPRRVVVLVTENRIGQFQVGDSVDVPTSMVTIIG